MNGWYYLLGEDVGRRKHMEVQGENRQPLAVKNQIQSTNSVSGISKRLSESKTITPVNKDVLWMDPHVVSSK